MAGCDRVINSNFHLRSSSGASNDIVSFYSTIYSTTFNKDFSSTCVNVQYDSGYARNIKPYVSLTPGWDSKSARNFYSDQFATVTDTDYKPFIFPNGHEKTPRYLLKSNLSRYGKEDVITTPIKEKVCSETERSNCSKSSEQTKPFQLRHPNPYSESELFLNNVVPTKSPTQLGAQEYQICDPKLKLRPWDNMAVTGEDYVDPFLYKSINHTPLLSSRAERKTGITLPKPLTGEDWYPFDRNMDKRSTVSIKTESLNSGYRLNKQVLNKDPCKVINAKYPRLVSIQEATYSWPDKSNDRTSRTSEFNKYCASSAYRSVDKSEVLPKRDTVCAGSFATETSRQFTNRSLADSGNKGFIHGNFSRAGLKDPRIMRQEEIKASSKAS